ncbi:S8 family peptidase [Mesorhizobium sp. M1004]|uniref:S8 family peptidase n=1 Tax=Mesorhizobium sp. M1004 TaxID=2957046 RepID=UPI0033361BFB
MKLIRIAYLTAKAGYEQSEPPDDKVDVLLTPWSGASAGEIAAYLREGTGKESVRVDWIGLNAGFVVARANLAAIVELVIPMTDWWQKFSDDFWNHETSYQSYFEMRDRNDPLSAILLKSHNWAIQYFRLAAIAGLAEGLRKADISRARALIATVERFAKLSGREPNEDIDDHVIPGSDGGTADIPTKLSANRDEPKAQDLLFLLMPFERAFSAELGGYLRADADFERDPAQNVDQAGDERTLRKALREPHVYALNLNRNAQPMLFDSRRTVKADAAQRVFDISTRDLTFAIIDGGIDATHRGFLDLSVPETQAELDAARSADGNHAVEAYGPAEMLVRLKRSRVMRTLDFTRLRLIQQAINVGVTNALVPQQIKDIVNNPAFALNVAHLQARGDLARDIDWAIVQPLIEMRHDQTYAPPRRGHGTHVAGILAAGRHQPVDIRTELVGMCPDLRLFDLRVFDDEGNSDEFTILSAIEFVGWVNRNRDYPVIHGANLSLALRHYVDSYACGRTPICEACNRLSSSGTVVVTAAGNTGFDSEARQMSLGSGYHSISITDPGNADGVITVGATHRRDPHAFGVSYFSSRGPTGDGRRKPDLVAPGEKITSTVPGDRSEQMDGTSMAAPHVSGAAAMLMARHPELIGQPAMIKDILTRTATDLGRERDFQGAGLVDVLRALQSI